MQLTLQEAMHGNPLSEQTEISGVTLQYLETYDKCCLILQAAKTCQRAQWPMLINR